MRKTRWIITIVLGFVSLTLSAQTDADKLLNGRRVDDYLAFTVNKSTVHVRIDGKTGATLTDGITFTSPGEIDLVYPNYNPFLMQISMEVTESEDPTSKAVAGFIDALIAMSKVVLPPPATKGTVAEFLAMQIDLREEAVTDCETVRRECIDKNRALTDKQEALKGLEGCEDDYRNCQCKKVKDKLDDAIAAIEKVRSQSVDEATANGWIETAQGKQGISDAREEIERERKTILEAIETGEAALAALPKLMAEAEALKCAPATNEISQPDVPTANELKILEQDLNTYIAAATKLAESLKELGTLLTSFENSRWRNNDQDLVFGTVRSDPKKIETTKITFTSREAKTAAKGVISLTDGDKEIRSFDVRRYRRLVPEVGVAMIYSDLQYPKYTAVEVPAVEGETTKSFKVGKETEEGKIDAALMLNFLCNCIGDETIFPGFQIGISKADDYPGLLAGVSLRFAGLKQISIGTGAMVTWFKVPKTLKVDGPVADQAALDKDLHRHRSPVAWYFGVQYVF